MATWARPHDETLNRPITYRGELDTKNQGEENLLLIYIMDFMYNKKFFDQTPKNFLITILRIACKSELLHAGL